jgi:UDP-2,3-diacylglucosamine hydrolase
MKYVVISDVHARQRHDQRYLKLLAFLETKHVLECDILVLLGDVFEFLVGPYQEFYDEFFAFFDKLKDYCRSGKQIWWIEGNHDFHFKSLITRNFSKDEFRNFHYFRSGEIFELNGKKVYIGHGDELDVLNLNYQKYRRIIRSSFVEYLTKEIFRYSVALKVKLRLSKQSKEHQKNFDFQNEKIKYLMYSTGLLNSGIDLIFLGHSHILESTGAYFNCGFFPKENKYFVVDEKNQISCFNI